MPRPSRKPTVQVATLQLWVGENLAGTLEPKVVYNLAGQLMGRAVMPI
jgi:hypothetical protein